MEGSPVTAVSCHGRWIEYFVVYIPMRAMEHSIMIVGMARQRAARYLLRYGPVETLQDSAASTAALANHQLEERQSSSVLRARLKGSER